MLSKAKLKYGLLVCYSTVMIFTIKIVLWKAQGVLHLNTAACPKHQEEKLTGTAKLYANIMQLIAEKSAFPWQFGDAGPVTF